MYHSELFTSIVVFDCPHSPLLILLKLSQFSAPTKLINVPNSLTYLFTSCGFFLDVFNVSFSPLLAPHDTKYFTLLNIKFTKLLPVDGLVKCARSLTFTGPCIVIYFYNKTNQMHQCIKFIYFRMTL